MRIRQLSASLLLTGLLLPGLSTAGSSETLPSPTNLSVERHDRTFKGRWDAVKGASYYEVWVNAFGRWSFDPKKLPTSPFTSSFEIPVTDERSVFKVRAVDSSGIKGDFSADVKATVAAPETTETEALSSSSNTTNGRGPDKFDPKAPPPEAPTGLFSLWTDNTTLKLVWREVKGAEKYAVEEYRDERWQSIPLLEFPKPNNAILKNYPTPGPYRFRVRAIGSNGRASEPSRPTTASR
ncbi:MAG TPA: hypothetical protein EYO33_31185 [Phycisphaerales bacterium]|nr:hypothetical protein [Phycisphaerales bacterium]